MQLNVCEDGRSVSVIAEMSDGTDIVVGFDLPAFVHPDDDNEHRRLAAEFSPAADERDDDSASLKFRLTQWEASELASISASLTQSANSPGRIAGFFTCPMARCGIREPAPN